MVKTNQWVCEHITESGQFQAALGNCDLDMLDTYQQLSDYEGTSMMAQLISPDTYESLGRITEKLGALQADALVKSPAAGSGV